MMLRKADLATRAEATARSVLADPTISDRLRQKALLVLAQADALRITDSALRAHPGYPAEGTERQHDE